MAKEKVFIVVSHLNSLKKNERTGKSIPNEWEVTETVEFVNQLKSKHTSMASVIGDYLNRKIVIGSRFGFDDYDKFESYIRTKYPKQMAELDGAYRESQVKVEPVREVFADQFGNIREKTVFDV